MVSGQTWHSRKPTTVMLRQNFHRNQSAAMEKYLQALAAVSEHTKAMAHLDRDDTMRTQAAYAQRRQKV